MNSLLIFLSRLVSEPKSWFRAVSRRRKLEAEMEAELAGHLENLAVDLVRAGYAPKEAARRARIALGSSAAHKDGMRSALGLRLWDELGADLRYAVRLIRKSPGFTAIAVLSLALAMGANTAIFSLANQLLYARLAVPRADELRLLRWDQQGNAAVQEMWGDFDPDGHGGMLGSIFSYPVYVALQKQNKALEDLLAFKNDGMNATIGGNAQQVQVEMVSGNYYSVLEVKPQLGRAIQPSDLAVPGAGAVAVISDELWDREFGRSPGVLGQIIKVNQAVLTIVGVNPRGFSGAKVVQRSPEVFLPMTMQPVVDPKGNTNLLDDPQMWWVNVMGRARTGVPDAMAQAALDAQLAAATRATMTVKAGETVPKLILADGSRGLGFADTFFKKPLYVLLTMTGLVLLLACVNIANLLLARGAQRQREISVRLALGASRRRILRQMLVESLLLSAMGGVAGLALGFLGRNWIPRLMGNPWEPAEFEVPFNWSVFVFTLGLTLITGLLFGLAPAIAAMRAQVSNSLKEGAQTATRRRKRLGGKSIVAFQIALSTLLVVGAALFLRTLLGLNSVDAGFRTDHLLLFEIDPPSHRYRGEKDIQLHQRLEEGFAALPGVQAVTASSNPLIAENVSGDRFQTEGRPAGDGKPDGDNFNVVGNNFFHVMGIPLMAGRSFGPQDTANSPKVAIINQALARERFTGVNPIGKRFQTGGSLGWIEIVGVCGDSHYQDLREPPATQFFLPYVQQAEAGGMTYQIRTGLGAAEIGPALRKVVQQADPDLPIIDMRTQQEQIAATMSTERALAALMTGFGALALALACVGIYGVMAYSVANRTNEIGIRLALGALPSRVMAMILREAGWVSLAGVAVGLCTALPLARLVKSMLYGLQPADPVSLAVAAGLLITVGLAASWIPAHRAASVQPTEALRHE